MATKKQSPSKAVIPTEQISQSILVVRGEKVILDTDLAALYGVQTKDLNKAVKRNLGRFPKDFLFQLTKQELANLRFHFGTSRWGGTRYLPYAFTEHGALMAASVLNTPRAVEVSVYVVRAFVKLRELLGSNQALAKKLNQLERKLSTHDQAITEILQAIRQLMAPPEATKKRAIGFAPWKD